MSTQYLPGHGGEPAVTDAQRERDRQARQEQQRLQSRSGHAIAPRTATTHGLFARDIALPALGEDPGAYDTLLQQFAAQIKPANLLERHYTEQIAAASWRLRRLHRWQAQLFEDPTLAEDQRLDKLDRVQRHEVALSRQIDRAVKMLVRELPHLFEGRARRAVLDELQTTEEECKEAVDLAVQVEERVREILNAMAPLPTLDLSRLDTAPAEGDTQNCQNENGNDENCQNELPADDAHEICQNEPSAKAESALNPDVNDVHPDGRPVYLTERDWNSLRYQRAHGDAHGADAYDAFARRQYLARREAHADTQQ